MEGEKKERRSSDQRRLPSRLLLLLEKNVTNFQSDYERFPLSNESASLIFIRREVLTSFSKSRRSLSLWISSDLSSEISVCLSRLSKDREIKEMNESQFETRKERQGEKAVLYSLRSVDLRSFGRVVTSQTR